MLSKCHETFLDIVVTNVNSHFCISKYLLLGKVTGWRIPKDRASQANDVSCWHPKTITKQEERLPGRQTGEVSGTRGWMQTVKFRKECTKQMDLNCGPGQTSAG